jgi:hypothetical protein
MKLLRLFFGTNRKVTEIDDLTAPPCEARDLRLASRTKAFRSSSGCTMPEEETFEASKTPSPLHLISVGTAHTRPRDDQSKLHVMITTIFMFIP